MCWFNWTGLSKVGAGSMQIALGTSRTNVSSSFTARRVFEARWGGEVLNDFLKIFFPSLCGISILTCQSLSSSDSSFLFFLRLPPSHILVNRLTYRKLEILFHYWIIDRRNGEIKIFQETCNFIYLWDNAVYVVVDKKMGRKGNI